MYIQPVVSFAQHASISKQRECLNVSGITTDRYRNIEH